MPATTAGVGAALRAAVPLFIPAIPFGLVLGVAITESTMPTAIAWSTNLFIFAGAAQLATVSLAATATWLTLVATAAVINLRHVMYSAALSSSFADQPRWFRWVGPFFLIDQLFALTIVRTEMTPAAWRRFYLSAGIFYFSAWTITVTVGLVVGTSIPTEWRLDVAPAIMFCGLVVLGLTNRPGIVAAVVGAGVCLLALDVPNNGGILIGAVSGVVAGYVAEVSAARRGGPPNVEAVGAWTAFAAAAAVLAVGMITYASRAGAIVFLADRPLPPNVTRALRYVGPAVLSALTVYLVAGGQGVGGIEGAEVAALGAAVVVAVVLHNLIAALAAGMTVLWLVLWLL